MDSQHLTYYKHLTVDGRPLMQNASLDHVMRFSKLEKKRKEKEPHTNTFRKKRRSHSTRASFRDLFFCFDCVHQVCVWRQYQRLTAAPVVEIAPHLARFPPLRLSAQPRASICFFVFLQHELLLMSPYARVCAFTVVIIVFRDRLL